MPGRVSIVVPTLNEAENIPLLVPRIAEAMRGHDWELLIVDDNSRDATGQVCAELARTYPLRLLVRERPVHGLSGAVLHGFSQATGDVLVVMDADLQHPPEQIPDLVETVSGGPADFALGSRYAGGSTEGGWGVFRQANSWAATVLARPFAGGVKDPMSGFFALRRDTFDRAERLSPLGYKIALELICKCRVKQLREVPIRFGVRHRGQSKLGLKQQFDYLQHLSRLYDFAFPRLAPIAKFLVVLAVGGAAAAAAFGLCRASGASFAVSMAVGYLLHILITALFHVRYIRVQREFLLTPRPWRDFLLISTGELLAVAVVSHWLGTRLSSPGPVEVFAAAFICGTVVRYVLRKELLLDVRGLRRELRADDIR